MKKSVTAANPEAYVASLDGWRRDLVEQLRATVLATTQLEEVVKWRDSFICRMDRCYSFAPKKSGGWHAFALA